ncbi:uncharacterized protein F4807DRAFT_470319 [Annulohypoxylon truncatum]|uniref:uncharacterized protein n=1 Tax=Annulohypoxylon truncatum TaxID=327061 RepID=UPI00200753AF|nr:uncharacterized protein F4807DRAFT_470319 [Annulohypoxylon truncatum]KAI1206366.1 hypothetical protein F4807DRAFT_470319 [Annulohypoxylon truncatum]
MDSVKAAINCAAKELASHVPLTIPSSNSSHTSSDSEFFFEKWRRKITREVRRRWRAEKKLKKARILLRTTLGKETAKKKGLRIKISPTIGDTSNPRDIWHELDFKHWLRRKTRMNPRRLTPSDNHVVSIHSKPVEEWDPWSKSHYSYSLKHRALVNKADRFYKEMSHFSVPRQLTAAEPSSDKDLAPAAETKDQSPENELGRFNRVAVRVLNRYLVSKGRQEEANSLKIQQVTLEPRDFALRVNAIAADCCTEMRELSSRVRCNAIDMNTCHKKRSREFKHWNVSRATLGRGSFGGLAAGRPSPLRMAISVDELEDQPLDAKSDTDPMKVDWDWSTESTNINYSSVEW